MSDALQATARERNALARWWERLSKIDPANQLARQERTERAVNQALAV